MNSIEPQLEAQTRYLYSQEDEIDLMELFAIAWQGKWLIGGIVLVSAVAAYVVITLLPPVYQISANIDQTTEYELQSVQPSQLDGGGSYQVASLSVEQLYYSVLAQSDALHVKRSFWEGYTGETLSSFQNGNELTDNQKAFIGFEEGFTISIEDDDSQNSGLAKLTITIENSEVGKEILDRYVGYLDESVINKTLAQLKIGLESQLTRLRSDYESRKLRELIKLEDQLIRLEEAFNLAKSLDIIETPYEQVENVESEVLNNRLYLLGTKALGEELKSLEERKNKPLEAFVPQLRDMELWMQQIEKDLAQLKEHKSSVHALVIITPAESSLRPVKPNKLLIFLASVFAAGLFSLALVFVLHGVKSYKVRMLANG